LYAQEKSLNKNYGREHMLLGIVSVDTLFTYWKRWHGRWPL